MYEVFKYQEKRNEGIRQQIRIIISIAIARLKTKRGSKINWIESRNKFI